MTKGKQVVLPSYLISETQGQQSSNGKSQASRLTSGRLSLGLWQRSLF